MKLGNLGCADPLGLSITISEEFTNSSNAFQKSSRQSFMLFSLQTPIGREYYSIKYTLKAVLCKLYCAYGAVILSLQDCYILRRRRKVILYSPPKLREAQYHLAQAKYNCNAI